MINLPNMLTIFRIITSPVLFFFNQESFLIFFIFAGNLSDFADGYLARKFDKTSVLGSILDPLADKIFFNAVLLKLYFINLIPAFLLIAFIFKDLILITGFAINFFFIKNKQNQSIKPLMISKISTSLLGLGSLVIFFNANIGLQILLFSLLGAYLSACLYVKSAVECIKVYKSKLNDKKYKEGME